MNGAIPRVSTRGRFRLLDGKPVPGRSAYTLYPARSFDKIYGCKEVAIMIHGLRNNPSSALEKFAIARRRLRQLGYKHPVIGFSYDSNTLGAHLKKTELRALRAGRRIAAYNGKNLARFMADFNTKSPDTTFRLLGHSLGSEVIASTVRHLDKSKRGRGLVSGVYFFGASVPSGQMRPGKLASAMQRTISDKIVNYYSPEDEVLSYADTEQSVRSPLGLVGVRGRTVSKYAQKHVRPKNHRFASYALTLHKFP